MDNFTIIDYSTKAIAVQCDREILADEFKLIGGRWNTRLKCGAAWIFSKKRHERQVNNVFDYYGLQVERKTLEDMPKSDTTSKATSGSTPDYIMMGQELRDWLKKTNSAYILKDAIKNTPLAVRLADGKIVPIESRRLKTEFWFGESDFQGPTYEEASASAEYARTNEDYFITENLEELTNVLDGLQGNRNDTAYRYLWLYACDTKDPKEKEYKLKWSNLHPKSANVREFLDRWEREQYDTGNMRGLTDEDTKRLIEGYKLAIELRGKRCRKYLKRYGLSKISARTYWMDR